jgi:hypothetical protein
MRAISFKTLDTDRSIFAASMKLDPFFAELKRRNVTKVAVATRCLVGFDPGSQPSVSVFEIPIGESN